MKLTPWKHVAMKAGMYQFARALHRQTFRRDQLQRFRAARSFFETLLRPNSLCFDVGANVGEISEALLAAGMRVVAFEPQEEPLKEAKHRCSRFPNSSFRQVAMGAVSGTMPLNISARGSATSSFRQNWEGESIGQTVVSVITLNDAIAEFGVPDYCKLDVEGWELEVLRGLSHRLPLLSFEYHATEANTALECLAYLSSFGTLSVNLTKNEHHSFLYDTWLTFPEVTKRGAGFFSHPYGDIFVRFANSDME